MRNNLKELYVSYPFMPVDVMPDWFGSVKFMRITVVLPARQPVNMQMNGDFIKATLISISQTTAQVRVECAQYGYNEVQPVDVFTGGIPYGNSYIYTDGALPTATGLSYRIHPGCLVFQQTAPALRMERWVSEQTPAMKLRLVFDNDQKIEGIPQWVASGDTGMASIEGSLVLEDGQNVEVSGSSGNVVFTGAAGAGKGIWKDDPRDISDASYNGYRGIGLRTINGHSGNVLIRGDRSVEIDPAEGTTIAIHETTPVSPEEVTA